jgi:hypothetical protein
MKRRAKEQVVGENEQFEAAVRKLEASAEPLSPEDAKPKIDRGLAQLERGEYVDGERFMTELLSDIDNASALAGPDEPLNPHYRSARRPPKNSRLPPEWEWRPRSTLLSAPVDVKVIRIQTANVAKALKIFETINDRGGGLDSMDRSGLPAARPPMMSGKIARLFSINIPLMILTNQTPND